jgi:hypothetical protein
MNIQFLTLSIFLIAKCPHVEIGTNKKLINGIAFRLSEGTTEGRALLKRVLHFPVLQIGPLLPAGLTYCVHSYLIGAEFSKLWK